ncbi:hypothetical protein [Accumulibacter sp.]|uniref:hypothetical protein n=1 Tax=Accumulibacter sp. TaxID=2053492 RepID=UPI0025DE5364|nr:hypothetical protein [Accumulibacter sp.]MCM8613645.1 hypothetical protein [Accumulibacter sp.]MCM8637327.1 hypothetical protein [Accumulibacter sp.]MCM8638189.1 hypothetical protein [Accumulibacter sp.]
MRIPAEIIPPVGNPNKEPDGARKPEPVGVAAGLANDLSASSQNDRALAGSEPAPARSAAAAAATPGSPAVDATVAVERRQGERRVENRPVLLDTRSKKGRRQGTASGRISIKV